MLFTSWNLFFNLSKDSGEIEYDDDMSIKNSYETSIDKFALKLEGHEIENSANKSSIMKLIAAYNNKWKPAIWHFLIDRKSSQAASVIYMSFIQFLF